ncbi:MAG: hypothetical protein HEQ39_04380 [Rhizobacter sp.]
MSAHFFGFKDQIQMGSERYAPMRQCLADRMRLRVLAAAVSTTPARPCTAASLVKHAGKVAS